MPGGSIEVEENPKIAAEREVYEESGVKGRILRSIGQVLVSGGYPIFEMISGTIVSLSQHKNIDILRGYSKYH